MKLIHAFSLLILTWLISCEKEVQDYRLPYTGNFHFSIKVCSWEYADPMYYDTAYQEYDGTIRFMEPGDESLDLYTDLDSLAPDSALFINFRLNSNMTTELLPGGKLAPRSGHHYYSSGGFSHPDTLNFSIRGLGGLGSGWSYIVKGVRY